jgi:hypothetical protein
MVAWIPGVPVEMATILRRLKWPEGRPMESLQARVVPPKGVWLVLRVDNALDKVLKSWNLKPFYNTQQVALKLTRGMKKEAEGPSA